MTKQAVLIVADTPRWFNLGILLRETYRASTDITVGISHKLLNDKSLDGRKRFKAISQIWTGGGPVHVTDVGAKNLDYNVIFSFHCQQMFSAELVTHRPCYNIHPGLFRHGRGWHPVTWARLTGRPVGATLYRMTDELDWGPVVDEIVLDGFKFEHTCYDIWRRVADAERNLVYKWFPRISAGKDIPVRRPGIAMPKPHTQQDLAELSRMQMSDKMTVSTLLNRLAALQHSRDGNYSRIVDARGNEFEVSIKIKRLPPTKED